MNADRIKLLKDFAAWGFASGAAMAAASMVAEGWMVVACLASAAVFLVLAGLSAGDGVRRGVSPEALRRSFIDWIAAGFAFMAVSGTVIVWCSGDPLAGREWLTLWLSAPVAWVVGDLAARLATRRARRPSSEGEA
jgi:hypothetical protein